MESVAQANALLAAQGRAVIDARRKRAGGGEADQTRQLRLVEHLGRLGDMCNRRQGSRHWHWHFHFPRRDKPPFDSHLYLAQSLLSRIAMRHAAGQFGSACHPDFIFRIPADFDGIPAVFLLAHACDLIRKITRKQPSSSRHTSRSPARPRRRYNVTCWTARMALDTRPQIILALRDKTILRRRSSR